MKGLLKIIFGSCLGVILAFGALFGILLLIGFAVGGGSKDKPIKSTSVLEVSLSGLIPERTNNIEQNFFELNQKDVYGIHELSYAIERAATDKKIEALVLRSGGSASMVKCDIIRRAVRKFKASGKPVYAYGDYYSQMDYYMASIADKIYLNPLGIAELKGFAVNAPFVTNFLSNLGVEMEVYYAGNFKSATEPFRRDEMSEENKLQLREFLDETFSAFLDTISISRSTSKHELNRIIDRYLSRDAQDALDLKLVDAIGYDSDMYDDLKTALSMENDSKLHVVDLNYYRSSITKKKNYSADYKIAVVYAEGELNENESTPGMITSDQYVALLRKIRRDKKVKAIVMRVNSPGGNALTSDKILEEVRLAKAQGIKVVTSMGDYAASGGYYISCESDTIVASPNTITGSIGVFIMFPNFSKALDQNLDINMDSVNTSPFAGSFAPYMPRSEKEKVVLQEMTDGFYDTFLGVVAQGRGMSKDEVHEVAQGRIWTGVKAKELGLVDVVGDLDDAIEIAASMIDTDDYRIAEYPEYKQPLEQMLDELVNEGGKDRYVESKFNELLPGISQWKARLESQSPQMLLPYDIQMK